MQARPHQAIPAVCRCPGGGPVEQVPAGVRSGHSGAGGGGEGQAEQALKGLLDFEAGAGEGDKLMRSHGFLPRVTGSYRDLLSNALGWISGK